MLIFAIDDERAQLETARRIISEAVPESEIMTFSDAADALNAVAQRGLRPEVVFTDIEMPGVSGLELAVRLKAAAPDTRLIFVTAYSEYAVDAFKVRAHGYVMKPLTLEDVREELENIPKPHAPDQEKLMVRCFGHFEVFWQGKPVIFQRRQTKELLAFLIDREGAACTGDEIAAALWEGETDAKTIRQRIRNLISDMKSTLAAIGMEDLLIRSRRQIAIRRDMVDCDYYNMLAGDISELNSFRGEYMSDYSWAEITVGRLYFHSE